MSAHETPETPDVPNDGPEYEQPPGQPECKCVGEVAAMAKSNRLAVSLATFATCLAMFALAVACFGWFTPEPEVRYVYVPSSEKTWAPKVPEPMPVDSTKTKEIKAYIEFLAKGAADIKKWRVAEQLQKASDANVVQLYLCDAKKPTWAGLYVAASRIDRDGDQDWGVANGELLGSPRAIALRWCTAPPKWAQPSVPRTNPDTDRVKPPNIGDPGDPDVP